MASGPQDGQRRTVTLDRGGARLNGIAEGTGMPVLFQHGLGASDAQAADILAPVPGLRRLTLECRAHGRSTAGTERPFSIAMFAGDALALVDRLGVGPFVAGGTSLGAAVALRLAVLHPARVRALLLVRPVWSFDAAPPSLAPLRDTAPALRGLPPAGGRSAFAGSATAQHLAQTSRDTLCTILDLLDRQPLAVVADLCDDLGRDGPVLRRQDADSLRMPALVIGQPDNPLHPLAVAETLAGALPAGQFRTIPAHAVGRGADYRAMAAAIAEFLRRLPVDQPQ